MNSGKPEQEKVGEALDLETHNLNVSKEVLEKLVEEPVSSTGRDGMRKESVLPSSELQVHKEQIRGGTSLPSIGAYFGAWKSVDAGAEPATEGNAGLSYTLDADGDDDEDTDVMTLRKLALSYVSYFFLSIYRVYLRLVGKLRIQDHIIIISFLSVVYLWKGLFWVLQCCSMIWKRCLVDRMGRENIRVLLFSFFVFAFSCAFSWLYYEMTFPEDLYASLVCTKARNSLVRDVLREQLSQLDTIQRAFLSIKKILAIVNYNHQ